MLACLLISSHDIAIVPATGQFHNSYNNLNKYVRVHYTNRCWLLVENRICMHAILYKCVCMSGWEEGVCFIFSFAFRGA